MNAPRGRDPSSASEPGAGGRVVSVQTGRPRDLTWSGGTVRTSILRSRRTGPVPVTPDGLDGDEVGDPSVHGGPRKAVYAYPSEHYRWWAERLGIDPLPWGAFGENLTVEGLLEAEVRPGDILSIGSARLVVTQPRSPCFKLNARFDRPDMIQQFLAADRPGFYLGVQQTGTLAGGDPIRVTSAEATGPSILEVFRSRRATRG